MNLPPCSQRAKPTSYLLTSKSSWGGPQPHTGHSPATPARGRQACTPRLKGSTHTQQTELGTTARTCFYLEACNTLGQGWRIFFFFFTKKERKKGNVIWPQDVFFAYGHHNSAIQTMGRRKIQPERTWSALSDIVEVIITVLFKNALWVAAESPAVSSRNASTRHWWHTHATHTHSNAHPAIPSLLGQWINQKQSDVLAPEELSGEGERETSKASCAELAVPKVPAEPADFKCHRNTSPGLGYTRHREQASWVSTLIG